MTKAMQTCVYNSAFHADFELAGRLVSQNGFLHLQRCMDTFVLILIHKGTLYISQNDTDYELGENEFILLFPNQKHTGTKPSKGELVYSWAHFQLTDPDAKITDNEIPGPIHPESTDEWQSENNEVFLPERGEIPYPSHTQQLFIQLIDLARRSHYRPSYKCHYMLSLLLMELCSEAQTLKNRKDLNFPPRFSQCMDYIRQNYHDHLSVDDLAQRFSYNPDYLAMLFTKYLGRGIVDYINWLRISAAKTMLANQSLTVDTVANQCGFRDTKYFYRVFKKYEQMTSGDWRKINPI